ncbi:TPA: DUF4291 domain-containing protein [Proteus mirabilis]|nr:DUF4291 domain-containing protein [Proteus mirabilis]
MNDDVDRCPECQVRAYYTDDFVRVYQAYSTTIAQSAVANGTFVSPPFSMTRMTWVKPSFLWMMYRSGWGRKDPNQASILAVDITHEGFQQMLTQGVVSHFDPDHYVSAKEWQEATETSDIRIQWDPERDIYLNRLSYRTIQIGLRNQAVEKYCNEWIVNITDITDKVRKIDICITNGDLDTAYSLLPVEQPYHFAK